MLRVGQAIQLGLLTDGEQLPPETEFAAQLGVSAMTLREALAMLRQQGLVETRRGRTGGTFVRRPDRPAARPAPRPAADDDRRRAARPDRRAERGLRRRRPAGGDAGLDGQRATAARPGRPAGRRADDRGADHGRQPVPHRGRDRVQVASGSPRSRLRCRQRWPSCSGCRSRPPGPPGPSGPPGSPRPLAAIAADDPPRRFRSLDPPRGGRGARGDRGRDRGGERIAGPAARRAARGGEPPPPHGPPASAAAPPLTGGNGQRSIMTRHARQRTRFLLLSWEGAGVG